MTITQFYDQGAVFSEDKKHRFRLYFEWDLDKPRMVLIMLNPSKADADPDSSFCFDPTLRSVLRLAENTGHGAVDVVNVYSVICTDPRELKQHALDLVRDDTDWHLSRVLGDPASARRVVCGWGCNWKGMRDPHSLLRERLDGRSLWCFGRNADGSPAHPLYLRTTTPLEPWGWPE